MDLLKRVIKERKICKLYIDGYEFDEWLIIKDGVANYIACDITEPRCWKIPKPFLKEFIQKFYRHAEEVEIRCPS